MFAWHVFGRVRRIRRLKGRLWGWHRLVSSLLSDYYSVCVTLTYAPDQSWCPKDISVFIKRVRNYYTYRGWRFMYFWVAELQGRGAVHYHVIIFVPKGHKLPKPDDAGWWKKGFTHIFAVKHFAAYLSKYLQKGIEGEVRFPRGLRLFGYGGFDWLERGMYRCGWLRRSMLERLRSVYGTFLVTNKKGSIVEILTSDGSRVIIYSGGDYHACSDQGSRWSQGGKGPS